jgi:hypothetical protein
MLSRDHAGVALLTIMSKNYLLCKNTSGRAGQKNVSGLKKQGIPPV